MGKYNRLNYNETIIKINFFAALLLVAFLPFSNQWITYFIALWVLTYILEGKLKLKTKEWKNWKLWLPISIVIINIFSICFSFDKATSFSIVQTLVSLVLIPLVFISVNKVYQFKKNSILISYVIGNFLLVLFLYCNFFYINQDAFQNDEITRNSLLGIFNRFSSNYVHHSYISLHISLAIVFVLHLLEINRRRKSTIFISIFLVILFSSVLIFLKSRAALLVFILLTFYLLFKYLNNVKFWIKALTLVIMVIGIGYVIMQSRLASNINWVFNKIGLEEKKYNLYQNENFEDGLKYWDAYAPDTITCIIIDSPYGKALRIKRDIGQGWWSLRYVGRKIYYHKDLTYNIFFKLKVLEGEKIPYNVRWWVQQGEFKSDLKLSIDSLNNGWLDCKASYTFMNDYQDLVTFTNSELTNSLFDITNIRLTCDDSTNRPMFVDQIEDMRITLWKNSLIVWNEKLIFGHGIGDAKSRLIEIHKDMVITEAYEKKYNSHNQFLETATQTGFIGLIVLLLVFAIPLYQSIKKKQELLFLFLVICFINFMFESMLQRLAGVVFFAFWYSYLWFVYYKDEKVIPNS
ncbi:MAG: hypothetical protein A2041_00405 [Bacteroidetes bacterium GWA2_31_9b]|nr:MAG: hypothetical protein A2041_00405 [Bacteroidetes bacterium GWA2_31_9b]